jgi:hypothetical protein
MYFEIRKGNRKKEKNTNLAGPLRPNSLTLGAGRAAPGSSCTAPPPSLCFSHLVSLSPFHSSLSPLASLSQDASPLALPRPRPHGRAQATRPTPAQAVQPDRPSARLATPTCRPPEPHPHLDAPATAASACPKAASNRTRAAMPRSPICAAPDPSRTTTRTRLPRRPSRPRRRRATNRLASSVPCLRVMELSLRSLLPPHVHPPLKSTPLMAMKHPRRPLLSLPLSIKPQPSPTLSLPQARSLLSVLSPSPFAVVKFVAGPSAQHLDGAPPAFKPLPTSCPAHCQTVRVHPLFTGARPCLRAVRCSPSMGPHRSSRTTVRTHRRNYAVHRRSDHAAH